MIKELVEGLKTASEKSRIVQEAQKEIRETGIIMPETLHRYEENRYSHPQFDLWFIIGERLYSLLAIPRTLKKDYRETEESLEKNMKKENVLQDCLCKD